MLIGPGVGLQLEYLGSLNSRLSLSSFNPLFCKQTQCITSVYSVVKKSVRLQLSKMFVLFILATLLTTSATESTKSNSKLPNSDPFYNQDTPHPSRMICVNSSYRGTEIRCSKDGPLLMVGYCATFDEDTELLSITQCLYFQTSNYNLSLTNPGYIHLPRNLSRLNDFMCGPLNRKGLVCSQCADGFGPSVTSFGYECVNCTDAWYGVPLYLLLEFVPLTVFFLVILVFQISVTSPPIPCFIMYAQLIVIALYVGCFSDDIQFCFLTVVKSHWV